MNRLNFKEEEMVDLTDESDAKKEQLARKKKLKKERKLARKKALRESKQTSYELFDLTQAEDLESGEELAEEEESDSLNRSSQAFDTKTPLKSQNVPTPQSFKEPTLPSSSSLVQNSSFLSKFLSAKRTPVDVPPPPQEPNLDTYLRLFSEQFQGNSPTKNEKSKDDEDDTVEFSEELKGDDIKELFQVEAYDVDGDDPNEELAGYIIHILNLYNLPYTSDEAEISDFLYDCGYSPRSILLGNGEKKGLPVGSASIEFKLPADYPIQTIIDDINGKHLANRPVRAQKPVNDSKKRMSFNKENRYFERDISCKCMNCGEVGHRSQECTNPSIPTPCHLCAGSDHEPGDCPNLICYRCGRFGHHSRECTSQTRRRPEICTQCGSIDHNLSSCPEFNSSDDSRYNRSVYNSLVEGPYIRCMACSQLGHANCKKFPEERPKQSKDKNNNLADIYCPNCGKQGHRLDLPICSAYYNPEYCMAPKYEAYQKYPNLLKEFNYKKGNMDEYYRSLVRNYNDINLFPSLCSGSRKRDFDRNSKHRRFSSDESSPYQSRQVTSYRTERDDDYDEEERASKRRRSEPNGENRRYSNDNNRYQRDRERDYEREKDRENDLKQYHRTTADRNWQQLNQKTPSNSYQTYNEKNTSSASKVKPNSQGQTSSASSSSPNNNYPRETKKDSNKTSQNPKDGKDWLSKLENRKRRFSN